MNANFTQVENRIAESLDAMVSRGRSVASYLNRVLYEKYKKAQIRRWETRNSSEGGTWKALTKPYAERKKKMFAAYPGAGNRLMVATGRLAAAATGEDTGGIYKIVTNSGIEIGINLSSLPYAKYPGALRPFMEFADETVDKWKRGIRAYIARGKE